MDSHQVGRGRLSTSSALKRIKAKTHLVGIHSDLLFTEKEQRYLAENIPGAFLEMIPSTFGHDGFLLEYDAISRVIQEFLSKENHSFRATVSAVS